MLAIVFALLPATACLRRDRQPGLPQLDALNRTFCGRSKVQSGRIHGGYEAQPGQFPSYLELIVPYDQSGTMIACGATLIHADVAITAAHCFMPDSNSSISNAAGAVVSAGTILKGAGTRRAVERICVHPSFKPNKEVGDFDVAVFTLSEPYKYTLAIQPACMDEPFRAITRDPKGDFMTLVGMGVSGFEGDRTEKLMSLDVLQACPDDGGAPTKTTSCLRWRHRRQRGSPCQGDSGGPAYARRRDGLMYLMGVISAAIHVEGQPGPCTGHPGDAVLVADFSKLASVRELIDGCRRRP